MGKKKKKASKGIKSIVDKKVNWQSFKLDTENDLYRITSNQVHATCVDINDVKGNKDLYYYDTVLVYKCSACNKVYLTGKEVSKHIRESECKNVNATPVMTHRKIRRNKYLP